MRGNKVGLCVNSVLHVRHMLEYFKILDAFLIESRLDMKFVGGLVVQACAWCVCVCVCVCVYRML